MDLILEQEVKKKLFLKEAKMQQIDKIIKKNNDLQVEKEKELWDKFDQREKRVNNVS